MEKVYEWRTTMNLRFIERGIPNGDGTGRLVRILQQQFTKHLANGMRVLAVPEDEWKDVPLECE